MAQEICLCTYNLIVGEGILQKLFFFLEIKISQRHQLFLYLK